MGGAGEAKRDHHGKTGQPLNRKAKDGLQGEDFTASNQDLIHAEGHRKVKERLKEVMGYDPTGKTQNAPTAKNMAVGAMTMTRDPIHPGKFLADELETLGMTPTPLAIALKAPPNRIYQLLAIPPASRRQAASRGFGLLWRPAHSRDS